MTPSDDDNPTPEQKGPLGSFPESPSADSAAEPAATPPPPPRKKSSRFLIRGMATLLPAVLTLWLLVFAYGFIRDKIASPINWGIQGAVIRFTDWPVATDDDYVNVWEDGLSPSQRDAWEMQAKELRRSFQKGQNRRAWTNLFERMKAEVGDLDTLPALAANDSYFEEAMRSQRLAWMKDQPEIVVIARREQLKTKWNSIAIGNWHVLDLIGLIVAIVFFYFAGAIMSNVLGRQLKDRGEKIIDRVPLIRRVYPAVKQVTDFFFGDNDQQLKFNRVVAVEYPRKGIYSVGLVTGDTMRSIEDAMGQSCLTVFIPSSPTPFTGYVITVPVSDTIDLGITIEDALKFAVSGGVLVPPSQFIKRDQIGHDRRESPGDRRSLTGDRREDSTDSDAETIQ